MQPKLRLNANPIVVKEMRSRMRGVRAFAILTVMLLFIGLASYGLFRVVTLTQNYVGSAISPMIGQVIFGGLALLELMAICFITPALTTGAISGENELQTYEMLMATPLNPASVLRGKLISALSYVFLLIFAAVPLASLAFTFGGIAPRDMLKTLILLIAVAVTLGIIGVFMSALLRRTGRATVLTYLLVVVLFFGTTLAYTFVAALRQQMPPRWLLVANPASALFSAVTPAQNGVDISSLLGALGMILGGSTGGLVPPNAFGTGIPRPIYHYTLVLYGGVALILYLLATRLVKPVRRWRLSRQDIAGGLALCLVFGGAVALAFGLSAKRYEQASIFAPQPTAVPVMAWGKAVPAVAFQQAVVIQGPTATPVLPPTTVPVTAALTPTPPPTPTPPATATPPPTPTPLSPPGVTGTLPTVPPSRAVALSEDDQAAIYAAVVQQLYTVDHTFGDQAPNFPVLYIVWTTDDSVGDPNLEKLEPQALSTGIQERVLVALADLPTQIRWVESRFDVPLEKPTDRVQGGGARIMLGNLHPQPDGSLLVSGSIYIANMAAGGRTYVLEQVDGVWKITGTTGTEWIS